MNDLQRSVWSGFPRFVFSVTVLAYPLGGCGPNVDANYQSLRQEGQAAMLRGEYGPARYLLLNAEGKRHRRVETLHDLGVCSVKVAQQKFKDRNVAAAYRELDNAVAYYARAIDERPGHQAALEGLNIALELKGQFDEALKSAEWAAEFVGPSARQQVFLADELEQRGDLDGALLRYRQGVAMEPKNPQAHIAFATFLARHDNEEAAMEHLAEAQRLDPRNRSVAERMASLRTRPAERMASKDHGARP